MTRVLILRTSRFVGNAITFARREWPDAEIRVVHQPGTDAELNDAGVVAEQRIRMRANDRIAPSTLVSSVWGRAAMRWRPDHVVVQWWNSYGAGHAAVDRTALMLQPRGFHVVFEDHSRQWMPATSWLWRALCVAPRRLAGITMILVIAAATVVLWPITAWRRHWHRRRMAASD